LTLAVPIIRVTIAADIPHLHRGHYRAPFDTGLECMATLCLAGPASELFFCGSITDGADRTDIATACEYLADYFDALTIEARIKQARDATDRLVRTAWAQGRIRLIAGALLQHGTFSGEEIASVRYH